MKVEVISVSRTPESWSETASAIQVLTGDEIRRSGATTLPEALRLANNLNVAQKNSHDWGISARGFNTELANKLLVMIDGRTVYTPLFSGVRWDVQDYLLADVEQIEVISGPGGTLWGANAVNGVINIITKSSADTQGLYVEGMGGSQIRQGYGFRYGGAVSSRIQYRLYGKYAERDGEFLPSGAGAPDAWRSGQIGFRMDAQPSPDDTLTFQGDVYRGTEGFVTGGGSDVRGGNLLGRWSRTLAGGSDLSLQLYFDRAALRQPVPLSPFAPAGYFQDDLDTYDLDFQHHVHWNERYQVVWGFGYRVTDDKTQAAPGLSFDPSMLSQELLSGFFQNEVAITPDISAILGTKVERTDYTGSEWEPSARLQWNLDSGNLLWGAVSRAVRTPSRIDRDIVQPNRSLVILKGSQNFVSETLLAYEVGYRTQLSSRLHASVATFYNQYDHIRSVRANPLTLIPLVFANDLEGETYGFEFTSSYQLFGWWRLTGGYNLLKEDIRVKPGRSDFNNGLNETADPQQQASLRSSMDFAAGIEIDAHLRFVDTLHVNNVGRVATVPSYCELDLRVGWRMDEQWEFAVVGRNLLHAQHPEFGIPSATRVEIGRSIHGKAVWRF